MTDLLPALTSSLLPIHTPPSLSCRQLAAQESLWHGAYCPLQGPQGRPGKYHFTNVRKRGGERRRRGRSKGGETRGALLVLSKSLMTTQPSYSLFIKGHSGGLRRPRVPGSPQHPPRLAQRGGPRESHERMQGQNLEGCQAGGMALRQLSAGQGDTGERHVGPFT